MTNSFPILAALLPKLLSGELRLRAADELAGDDSERIAFPTTR